MTPNRQRPSLARRALPALVLTGASGFLLSALDHPANTASAAGTLPKTSTAPKTGTGTAPTTPTTRPQRQPNGGPPPGGDDDGPGAGQTATPATSKPRTTTTTAASAVPAAPAECTTKTGPVVNTRFGPVQVQASVSADGKTICSVDAIQTPNDRRRSVLINQQAVPMLNDQVMQAQSANIDGVSGATITSNAYYKSLQAILDGKGT